VVVTQGLVRTVKAPRPVAADHQDADEVAADLDAPVVDGGVVALGNVARIVTTEPRDGSKIDPEKQLSKMKSACRDWMRRA
jgi:hypothetical protein